jgi:hypothetical protein
MSAAQKQQAALRATYGEEATGAEKTLADMVRNRVWNNSSDLQTFFPVINRHIAKAQANHWKFTHLEDELVDYGRASWQGRTIRAIVSKAHFKRENAILGLYAKDCFNLAYLIDDEFHIRRDSVSFDCSDTSSLDVWLQGHNFKSLWIITP